MPRMRGAIKSPRHKLAAAVPHRRLAAPASYANLAPALHMWGNDRFGDCVSAEEAAAKAIAEPTAVAISDTRLIGWATAHGFLNGANLTDVMDAMRTDGIDTAFDGPYQSVDWTDWPTLTSAIFLGQVKIAVAANQLEAAVTNSNGWLLLEARHDDAIDHCVGLPGYGRLDECCKALNVRTPPGAALDTLCVIMFTWRTYGIVSHAALVSLTAEAWLRVPTTIIGGPNPPPPPPPPPPPTPRPWCHPAVKRAVGEIAHAIAVAAKAME